MMAQCSARDDDALSHEMRRGVISVRVRNSDLLTTCIYTNLRSNTAAALTLREAIRPLPDKSTEMKNCYLPIPACNSCHPALSLILFHTKYMRVIQIAHTAAGLITDMITSHHMW